jgi:16S rRNA (guanine966-N2)-methyltransferase
MRIIAGTYGGRYLKTLKGGKLRPTSDHLRETLFDVLGPLVEGSAFLDAYAGSGAVGIEALSRGAREVVFIEHHRPAAQLIKDNLAALGIEGGYWLMKTPVLSSLEKLAEDGSRFDFVFLDPPYEEIREYHHALRELARSTLVGPSSVVIAEHSRHVILEENYGKLRRTRSLRRGDSQLAFYRLN